MKHTPHISLSNPPAPNPIPQSPPPIPKSLLPIPSPIFSSATRKRRRSEEDEENTVRQSSPIDVSPPKRCKTVEHTKIKETSEGDMRLCQSKSSRRIIFAKSGEFVSIQVSQAPFNEKHLKSLIEEPRPIKYRCNKSNKLLNIDSRIFYSFDSKDRLPIEELIFSDDRIKYSRTFLLSYMKKYHNKCKKRKWNSSLDEEVEVESHPIAKRLRTLDSCTNFNTGCTKGSVDCLETIVAKESPLELVNLNTDINLDGEHLLRKKYSIGNNRKKLSERNMRTELSAVMLEGKSDDDIHGIKQTKVIGFQQTNFHPLSKFSRKWRRLWKIHPSDFRTKGNTRGKQLVHGKHVYDTSSSFNISSSYNHACVIKLYNLETRPLMDLFLFGLYIMDSLYCRFLIDIEKISTPDIDQEKLEFLFCSCQITTSIWFSCTLPSRFIVDTETKAISDIDQENLKFLFSSYHDLPPISVPSQIHQVRFLDSIFSDIQSDLKNELIFVFMSVAWEFWIHRKLQSFAKDSVPCTDTATSSHQFRSFYIMIVFVMFRLVTYLYAM